jgi:16S rRNA (cytosine967-C5)-methyltransferase
VSSSASIRAQAARIVAQVAHHGRSLDALLVAERQETAQQRGLLRSLCYDSLRWYLRLDALLDRLLTRNQALTPEIRSLALVGLCQLLYTDIPAHAAVAETVNAARALGHPRAAGLINAVLRRLQRERQQLGDEVDLRKDIRTAHPRWLVDALEADWGNATDEILQANNERPPFWIRVNRRRTSGAEYRAQLQALGIGIKAAAHDDETLCLDRAFDVAELPGFADGLVSVQDAAAQLAARLLAPGPGERVLDACAAPGGKTGHLLELQPELRELVAIDVSGERLWRVADNLRRLGLPARLIEGDAAAPSDWWDGVAFDRILLDVPCSATGVIRRHPDIKLLRRAADIPALAQRQVQLLRALWPLLAPGGRLLYASCSVLQAENAAVIEAFLAECPQASDMTSDITATIGAALGLTDRHARGYRIAPGAGGMDGFYYACLKKI